jgi:hypothetical protein
MRVGALTLLLLQASSAALAQPKPTTEMMHCERLQTLVAMHGAAVLNTSPGTACASSPIRGPAPTVTSLSPCIFPPGMTQGVLS